MPPDTTGELLYQALPPYPGVIRGRFDPQRWAADPNRRSDVFDADTPMEPPSETVSGFPARPVWSRGPPG